MKSQDFTARNVKTQCHHNIISAICFFWFFSDIILHETAGFNSLIYYAN